MIINRNDWYSTDYVLHQIRPQLRNRYLSVRRYNTETKKWILSRYYMGYSIDLLKDSLKRNKALTDNSAKLYYDLATWKDNDGITPTFSFDKHQRKKQKEDFSKNDGWKKLIRGYDFAIDFDDKKINSALKDCCVVKNILDRYRLPYILTFSGSKGFHIKIEDRWIKTRLSPTKRAELFGKVVNNIMEENNLKTIDTSIYDPRRILKLAYSLCNNEGYEYVCLPLNDYQFDTFSFEKMRIDNVLKNVKIYNRGLLERTHGLDEKTLILNTSKFIRLQKVT